MPGTNKQTILIGMRNDSVDTLTNKTLDDYTNFIHANGVHLRVKATTALSYGDCISFVGFNSGEQAIEVKKKDSIIEPVIGLIHEDLAIGEFGMALSNGLFQDINTIAFPEGTILYANSSGGFTSTPSELENAYNQPFAYVVRSHAVNGEIMINIGPKQPNISWEYLATNWSTEPTLNTAITGGEVYNYTLNGTTRYRFVPSTYTPTQDAFYSTFDGVNLSNLIITRG